MPKQDPLSRCRARRDFARTAEPRGEPDRLDPKTFTIGSARTLLRRKDPWADFAAVAVPLPTLHSARP
jgi:hypothetical protein